MDVAYRKCIHDLRCKVLCLRLRCTDLLYQLLSYRSRLLTDRLVFVHVRSQITTGDQLHHYTCTNGVSRAEMQ